MADECLLAVNNLKVEFDTEDGPVTAVADVSFDIKPGETVVIVGESGTGKSVTSLAIMRLIADPPGRITSGQINFRTKDGRQIDLAQQRVSAMRRIRGNDVAMIFQEPLTSLNPVCTISEILFKGQDIANARAYDLQSVVPVPDPDRKRDRIVLKGVIPSPMNPPSGCVFRPRCPYAIDDCAKTVPQLREVSPGHLKACIRDDVL